MVVDSFKWLPPRLVEMVDDWPVSSQRAWTPLAGPLSDLRLALVTTAGLYVKGQDPPFDLERERREGFWGDPTSRAIGQDVPAEQIGVAHLHINREPVLADLGVVLPRDQASSAREDGLIGEVAGTHHSVMGFQLDTTVWETETLPHVARELQRDGVQVAVLTPV